MASNADYFLNKALGEDFLESLSKSDIWKPGTKSVSDLEDMKTGMKIVPRTIMALLVRELASMETSQNKRIALPVSGSAFLNATKHERDQFSGDIEHDGKKVTEFKFRSIPGIGLVIMSTFELYAVDELEKESAKDHVDAEKIQRIIDERIALHDLVNKVVDKKLTEKDAVHSLWLMKLTEELQKEKVKSAKIAEIRKIQEQTTPQSEPYFRGMTNGIEVANSIANEKEAEFVDAPKKKSRPLNDFLEKRQSKKEFSVHMAKGETVNCDSCGKEIFSNFAYSGCICMGDNMDSKIYIKKSEDGVKIRFGKGWDEENIEMLLEVLRKKHG